MSQTFTRQQFLQLAAWSPAAFLLGAMDLGAAVPENQPRFVRAGDTDYDVLRHGFNKRIDHRPALIAVCKNAAQVASAVRFASEHNVPIAIKSGGHCMEGFSCNEGGMVINLSPMKALRWIDKQTVQVEPGCTLAELYDAVLPTGRIVPGGSCGGVGIGGLVLGGGYGLLARQFGLTCDSLLAVTMVDGSGRVISSADDPELLWACKGGGNGNFGVITSLTFKTHQAPATMQSFRFRCRAVDSARAKKILEKWFALTATLPNSCFSAFVLNGKSLYILLTNTGKLSPLVQHVVTTLGAHSDKSTRNQPVPLQPALRVFYGRPHPLYFKNASAGLYKDFSTIAGCISKVIDQVLRTPGMIYQVNTLGGRVHDKEMERGSAFPHRAYGYFSELQSYWEQPEQGAKFLDHFAAIQAIFADHGIAAHYRNYPDLQFQDWSKMYYGDNYTRLQNVKKRYDPGNLIRHPQSVQLQEPIA
jgi:hypothetical protein